MRIGINLLFLIPGEVGGTETYSKGLVTSLAETNPQDQFYVFINLESQQLDFLEIPNIIKVLCPINARNRYLRILWEQIILPLQILHVHPDLLHSLGYITPLLLPCKSIITIHDINYQFVPKSMSYITRVVQRNLVKASTRSASHIITVSNFVRDQLYKYLKIPPHKITAIHEATNLNLKVFPVHSKMDIQDKYGITKPYIITFSSLTPHKNIAGLIKSFRKIYCLTPLCYQLVIIGHQPKNNSKLNDLIHQLDLPKQSIIFTGYVPEHDVFSLLTHSDLFVFPSFYEGFGLPLIEAMSAGVAVVCSNRGSLPEVAGDAALFFDPENIQDMSNIILRVLKNEDLRLDLIIKGKKNLKRFSWEKTAKETHKIYEFVIGNIS